MKLPAERPDLSEFVSTTYLAGYGTKQHQFLASKVTVLVENPPRFFPGDFPHQSGPVLAKCHRPKSDWRNSQSRLAQLAEATQRAKRSSILLEGVHLDLGHFEVQHPPNATAR